LTRRLGRTETQSVAIGVAWRMPDGWVLTGEAEIRLQQKPSARVSIGKVWK
jgi:hypothetical protein